MGNRQPHPRVPARRRGLRILMGFGVIALAVVVAGYFFGRRQVGEFFAGQLGEALAEDGVFINWKSADWVPGGGIRLHELALYRDAARHDRLALFGLVTVRRPEPSLLRWDKMNFKAVDTLLMLGSGAGETRLERMNMLLLVQPGRTDVPVCEASLQGLRIEFQCALTNAPPTGTAEEIAAARLVTQREGLFRNVSFDWLKSAKEWLEFQPEKDEPVLKMNLHSPEDNGGQVLTMRFDGEAFQWRGLKWDFSQVAVTIPIGGKSPPIDIEHVRIGHAGRNAEIAGAFDPISRVIRISKFDSGIDLLALARAYNPDYIGNLSKVSSSGDWQISGAVEIPVDHPENCRGHVDVALDGDLVHTSGQTNVTLQNPAFSVRLEEQMVAISGLKAGLWDGNLHAQNIQIHLPSKERKLRVETHLTLNGVQPQSILNSLGETRKPAGVVPWDWNGAWQIDGAMEIPVDHPENFRWHGDAALDGDLVYASGQTNVTLQNPAFSVRAEKQVVAISDFKAGLWEGNLNAPKTLITLPSANKKLRFETQLTLNGARSQSVRRSFSAKQKQPRVIRLSWKGAWRMSAAGEIPADHPENFRWHGDVALDGDLVYASGETNVALQKPVFSVNAEKEVVTISNFKAGLWGGSLNAPKTLIHLPSTKRKLRFETHIALADARLQSIVGSFGGTHPAPGIVQCDWIGGGHDLQSLAGSGKLSIGEAEFCRMPFVGPLHRVFRILAPGFRKDAPSTMAVNHRVAGGTLYLEELNLVSAQALIGAKGTIDLASEHTQLTAKGRLRRLPGLVTVLLTRLLEFKGEGPVGDIRWTFTALPPGFRPIINPPKKITATEKEEETEDSRAVKGLIELPGKVLREE